MTSFQKSDKGWNIIKEREAFMKLQTDFKLFILAIFVITGSSMSYGQVGQSNPLHYIEIMKGQSSINSSIKGQTNDMAKISANQTAMAAEFTQIKKWEEKYNSYLKTARGYAEALKAGSTLISDGVSTLQRLIEIKKAIEANPQGIGATIAMNDLYGETAVELLKTYRLMKMSVALGTEKNMLTGKERTELLWWLSDQLSQLNTKLHQLAFSIAYYNLKDVWINITAGIIDKDHGQIAQEALDRWKRARNVNQILK